MRVRFTKGHSNTDYVSFKKPDGTDISLEIPKEPGCMPKAMARSVVERVLGRSSSISEMYMNLESYETTASSDPTWKTTELLLKILQDELTSKGKISPGDISFQLRNVSRLLLLPFANIAHTKIDLIAKEVAQIFERWQALPPGQSIVLNTTVPLGANAIEEVEPFCVEQGSGKPQAGDQGNQNNA